MKRRLLSDVDGVIADFIELYLRHTLLTCGIKKEPEDVTSWNTGEAIGLDAMQRTAVRHVLNSPGAAFDMKPYPGAVEALRELVPYVDLHFVTSPIGSPTWTHDREQWLRLHFGPEQGAKVTHTHDKYICGGNWFIDDKPEHIEAWVEAHPDSQAIIWDQPYNQEFSDERVIRTNDWELIKELVLGGGRQAS